MNFFNFLSLIGGLALFLYGMEVLGEGLSKLTGGKLEKILEKLTSNPIKAILLGAGVTAVIQSSSATTVMVVGLVNSSVMKLQQAVGVIMGANIGTTFTSWILSLTGIQSDSFFIQMIKPNNFSPIVAIIGVGMILFSKKERKRNIGKIMIGFAILMFGMESMSSSVEPLADIPEFRELFVMFENPILGMLVGLVLTSLIQSSSASVGILQALCMTGTVTFASAIPIILGQNIGTCVTAIISAIGVGKNGKRAACIHLYFNLLGTMLFLVVFYALNAIFKFSFMPHAATAVDIAIVHSTFNIFATICLFPLRGLLLKLATITIKIDEEEDAEKTKFEKNIALLDELFLERPAFALEQCDHVVNAMAQLAKKCIFRSVEIVKNYTEENFEKIKSMEKDTDSYDDAISTYLVKLSTKDLADNNRKYINVLFHMIGHLERMTDHALNVAESAKSFNEKGMVLTPDAYKEIDVYGKAIQDIVDKSVHCLQDKDLDLAKDIEPLEELVDNLTKELKDRHIKRLTKNQCSVDAGFVWTDWMTDFERISDHCSNIALSVIETTKNDANMHEYIEHLKKEKNGLFMEKYNIYKEQYQLPSEFSA